ncbi:hypothetical protein ACOBQX_03850 [Actinokineospora sp. G85]|uniref:hypothetical protein n=1 Tax=Actinokineospora sp. G85 TaxID=3406626 RepID=UPI003C78B974
MVHAPQDPPAPPDDPAWSTMSADQLAELVFAMDPEVHYRLAQAIDEATARFQQVLDGIRREARVVQEGLSGESLVAFDDVSRQLGTSVDEVLQTAWNPDYATTLRAAGDALAAAQQRFRDLRGQQAEESAAPPVEGAPAPEVLRAQRTESALQVVLDLGTAYRDIGARFTPLPLLPGGQGWEAPQQPVVRNGSTNALAFTGGDQPHSGDGAPGGQGGGFGSGAFFASGPGQGGFGPGGPGQRKAVAPGAPLGSGGSPVIGRSVEVTPRSTVRSDMCGPAAGDPWAAAIAPAHGVVAGAVGLPPAVLGRVPGGVGGPSPAKRKRAVDERQQVPEVDPGQERAVVEQPVKVTADPVVEPAVPPVVPALPATVSTPPVTAPVQVPATLAASAAPVAHAGGGVSIPAVSVPVVEPVTLDHGTTLPASTQFGPPPVRPLAAEAPVVPLAAPPPGGTSAQTSFNGHSGMPMAPGYGPMNPMGGGVRGPDERDSGRFAEIPMEAEAGVWHSPGGATVLGRPVAAEKSAPSSGGHPADQPAAGNQRSEEDKTLLDQARERALQMIGRTTERER